MKFKNKKQKKKNISMHLCTYHFFLRGGGGGGGGGLQGELNNKIILIPGN